VLSNYLKDKDCLNKDPWGSFKNKPNGTFKWNNNSSETAIKKDALKKVEE
jgi:hypothetical protein